MSNKLNICKLESGHIHDAARLIKLLNQSMVNSRKDIFLPDDNNFEEYLVSGLSNEDMVLLTATIDNNVVGTCTAEIKHVGDGCKTCVRDILFIDYIVIDEKYRRNKIGTKFLDEIKKIAKDRGCQSVELNVWSFNTSAIEFYDNSGMTPKRTIYECIIDKE